MRREEMNGLIEEHLRAKRAGDPAESVAMRVLSAIITQLGEPDEHTALTAAAHE